MLTEEQMRSRMKEINKEIDKLRNEKKIYESHFSDKKDEEEFKKYRSYIGKCYITRNLSGNENKHIKAFKIIDVHEIPHHRYAECIALIDGRRYTCFNEYGVQRMTLCLFYFNKRSLMNKESEPKVIDFYTEIPQEEFNQLYSEYMDKLLNCEERCNGNS